ncbi:hypothetical protein SPRG_11179 [Saprolegnia parasitica CBS 223.65]|uniref:Uncharacterized protein n=1 Tax=Saprolegnia parasitica (strain CBS 223.65) TaxID=695850 RepID=A0A067BXL6_SAPPC|nr:hypothetical protein SPRG_11179 [Saprolegnia parasitica CBS 223.65]KDO23249.1 hypothetical protein SPRG_11179 [Saprolegnia parasitica CBS 223.65]|eukprot:XP_012206038.1 hypothetical protein SPRG_11179 [Saprolegnia parasitica CBS 223.65]
MDRLEPPWAVDPSGAIIAMLHFRSRQASPAIPGIACQVEWGTLGVHTVDSNDTRVA